MTEDDILDPAHDPNAGENVGAAGIAKPEGTDKPEDVVKVSEDGNLIERGGVKYVRHEALHNERTARQKAETALSQLEPVLPEFQEFLRQRDNRNNATVDRAVRDSRTENPDYTEDELEGFAITRAYYKDDGVTPDTKRAEKELAIISGISRRQAQREVRPVAELSAKDRARANRERTRGAKFVDGQPIADDKYLDAAHNALPEEMLADPQVAALTQLIAVGLQTLDERKNGTRRASTPQRRSASGEPMFVERGTGRYDGDDGEISPLDAAAARARGKTPEQWKKMSGKVNNTRAALDEV